MLLQSSWTTTGMMLYYKYHRIKFLQVRIEFLRLRIEFLQVRIEFLQVRIEFLQLRIEFLQVRIEFLQLRIIVFSPYFSRLHIPTLQAKSHEGKSGQVHRQN